MANRTKDEVIYVRADRRLKDRFEKQKDESGYRGNADFISYLLDVNERKRVDGVTLKEIRELLKEAVHELKKQGVNLNQIAHAVNMYADLFSDSSFKTTNYFLRKIEDKLLQISEKLIQKGRERRKIMGAVYSPLVSYVWLTINGEDHGLYIAIEDISEGYLNRVCDGEGELYKPETEQLANMGQAGGIQQPDNMEMPDAGNMPFPGNADGSDNTNGDNRPQFPGNQQQGTDKQGMQPPSGENGNIPEMPENGTFPDGMTIPESGEMPEMPQGGGKRMPGGNMGFGSSSSSADLAYIDDEISSYSDIFDNAETDADEEAKMRVISALKGLAEENDLENYLNTEEIIRYFVAHNFILNYDSYTGNMLHNYYLYENDGKLSMLPWDYNLAFGGFSGNGGESGGVDTTSLVNCCLAH